MIPIYDYRHRNESNKVLQTARRKAKQGEEVPTDVKSRLYLPTTY